MALELEYRQGNSSLEVMGFESPKMNLECSKSLPSNPCLEKSILLSLSICHSDTALKPLRFVHLLLDCKYLRHTVSRQQLRRCSTILPDKSLSVLYRSADNNSQRGTYHKKTGECTVGTDPSDIWLERRHPEGSSSLPLSP